VRVFWVRDVEDVGRRRRTDDGYVQRSARRPLRNTSPTITKSSRVVVPASRADQLKRARSFRIVITVALPFMVPQLPPPVGRPSPIVVITYYFYTVCLDNDHF